MPFPHRHFPPLPCALPCSFAPFVSSPQGFSGADLTEVCQRAAKLAIRESIAEDLDRAQLLANGVIKAREEVPDKVGKELLLECF